jgi:hypothetical protein
MTPTSVTIKLAVTSQITIINLVYITFTTQQNKSPVSTETMHPKLMSGCRRHVNAVVAACDLQFSKRNTHSSEQLNAEYSHCGRTKQLYELSYVPHGKIHKFKFAIKYYEKT